MTMTAEIQNKEKSLAELMARILREPFKPLGDSLKGLTDTLLDTQDRISELGDTASLAVVETENVKKSLAKGLRKISDDDLPQLARTLQEHASAQLIAKTQEISASLDKLAADLADRIAASGSALAEGVEISATQIGHAIARQQLDDKAVASALFEQLENASARQRELGQAVAELHRHISATGETAQADQAAAMQGALLEIRTSREWGAKSATGLADQFESGIQRISADLSGTSTEVSALMIEHRRTTQAVTELLQSNQAALTAVLRQENAALTEQMSACQAKLKSLGVTTTIFFASVLAYIGYDIWSKFQ